MNPDQTSSPAFKISHPEKPEIAPQLAWTQLQAENKCARLIAEHGEGFVIGPAVEPAPSPTPEENPPRKIVGRDDPLRCPEQPFVAGDFIRCRISGTMAEVLAVDQTGADIQAIDGAPSRLPADNYGDYTLELEAEYVEPPPAAPVPVSEPPPPAPPFAPRDLIRCTISGTIARVTGHTTAGLAVVTIDDGRPGLIPEANWADYELHEAAGPEPVAELTPEPSAPPVVEPEPVKKKVIPGRPALKKIPATQPDNNS